MNARQPGLNGSEAQAIEQACAERRLGHWPTDRGHVTTSTDAKGRLVYSVRRNTDKGWSATPWALVGPSNPQEAR